MSCRGSVPYGFNASLYAARHPGSSPSQECCSDPVQTQLLGPRMHPPRIIRPCSAARHTSGLPGIPNTNGRAGLPHSGHAFIRPLCHVDIVIGIEVPMGRSDHSRSVPPGLAKPSSKDLTPQAITLRDSDLRPALATGVDVQLGGRVLDAVVGHNRRRCLPPPAWHRRRAWGAARVIKFSHPPRSGGGP